MGDSEQGPIVELSQELSRFMTGCEAAGRALAIASEALARLEALPEPTLVEEIERLREVRRSLLERAVAAKAQLGDQSGETPGHEAGLDHVIGFVREVIASEENRSARSAAVLDLLGKMTRLTVNAGDDLPALAVVRSQAIELLERVQGEAGSVALSEFVELSGGSHPFCHLISLVENVDISPEERAESLIEVACLGKEVAHAARSRRLIVGADRASRGVLSDPTELPVPIQMADQQPNASAPPNEPMRGELPEAPEEVPPAGGGGTDDSLVAPPPATPPAATPRAERSDRTGVQLRAGGRDIRKVARRPAFGPRLVADRPPVAKIPISGDPRFPHFEDLLGLSREPGRLDVRILPEPPSGLSKNDENLPADAPVPDVSVPPASTERLTPLLGSFPEELRDFAAFRASHWINSDGRCEEAPWTSPEFAHELKFRAVDSLGQPGRLILFARAAESLGLAPPYAGEDIEALAALLAAPFRAEAGRDPKRGLRLADSIREATLDDTPAWKLAVALEAFRPSGEFLLGPDYPEPLVGYAGFRHEPLRKILKELLVMSGRGAERPLETIRFALRSEATPTPEQRMAHIRARREAFRRLIAQHFSAGGRLKTSHSRDAWGEFVREGKEFFESLYTVADTKSLPDPRAVAAQTDRLWKRYETIADRGGVKYGDRRRMDRMVEQILDAAEEIGELAGRVRGDGNAKPATIDPALMETLANLAEWESPDDLTEIACVDLLRILLDEAPPVGERRVMELTIGDLAACPGLVSVIPSEAAAEIVAGATAEEPVCRCDEVSDALTAAALLLAPWPAGSPDELSGRRLSEALQGQPERLVRLLRILSDPQRAAARRDIERQRDEAQERVNGLKVARNALDALVSRWAGDVGRVYEAGQLLVDDPATEEFALALGWLDRSLGAANARLDAEVSQLIARVEETLSGEASERALRAVADGRYGDALQILGDPEAEARDDGRRLRETFYRKPSHERFPDPFRAMAGSTDPATLELRASWRSGINGQDDRKFRNDFLRFLCSRRSKRKASAPLEKEARFDNQDCRLPTHAIRERISEFGLNPCYLPQLADFKELIVLVPPTQVRSTKFVKATADEVARRGQGVLCVVLAPAITPAARDALLKEFRDRKRVAAVIDDLDFCRLLNPGGEAPDPLVGFFEIFLEQQRWETLSPYSGRLVEKEMFVGRLDEAGDLKRTNKYSRLFSGRKLGKTSLLNHVLQTSGGDAERLPSGNILRVLLITSVGPDAREVVDEVRAQLSERLGFQPSLPSSGEDPGDDLEALAGAFVAERPGESLLVIIDEADSLFEKELELYETKLERGLSFRMSREVERKHLDSEGLPRVRFLFSGYRVTNKSEGVWANWGDVLRLTPLEPQDADNLAAGPLARMGIDLGNQTRVVSSRCGYQPAVLLRFGRELLAHLDRTHPPSRREHVTVSAEDVAQVLHRESVRDEIRTVVRYNFIPGNRLGELVFEALLLELHGVPPAAGLPEASKRVLDRLREIDLNTSWLLIREASAESEIERQIADFVERQLLTERHEGDEKVRTHRLRFPHHLAVLCPNESDSDRKLREGINAFRRGEASVAAGVRSLFSPRVMDDLRYVITRGEHPDEPARAAIVGSTWPEAISHRSFGVPILLGLDNDLTIRAYGRIDGPRLSSRRLAVLDAGPEAVLHVLRDRGPGLCRPLFTGGADLLRWAIGQAGLGGDGVDLVHYGLGRMNPASLDWWFSRVRRLGFPAGPDPVGQLHHATGGIPLLVRHFDEMLLAKGFGAENSSKEDVPREDFLQALNLLRDDLPRLASGLRDGPPALRLEARERQLLAMVARVVRQEGEGCTAENLRYGLTEGWDEFYRAEDLEGVSEVDEAGDQDVLDLLQGLGLLPFAPDRSASYPLGRLEPPRAGDPLFLLVDLLSGEADR